MVLVILLFLAIIAFSFGRFAPVKRLPWKIITEMCYVKPFSTHLSLKGLSSATASVTAI